MKYQAASTNSTNAAANELIATVNGRVGFISLNRPKALNALSFTMLQQLTKVLTAWQRDENIIAVAIRGCDSGGGFGNFCAGGDIRWLYQQWPDNSAAIAQFFQLEYRLDYFIRYYPKPIIACLDGITMGGGMGIAQGASLRLVTERSRLAMPETAIGLFTDAGGGYFLSRCPQFVGEWLALTGSSIAAAAALEFGLADAYIDSAQLPQLWQALAQSDLADAAAVTALVAQFLTTVEPEPLPLPLPLAAINKVFSLPDVVQIIAALEADPGEWAQTTAAALRRNSPLLLAVVLQQIRLARQLSFAAVMRLELSMVAHSFSTQQPHCEVIEGIRAMLIDKDRQPGWQFDCIERVNAAAVAQFFLPRWSAQQHPFKDLT